MSRIQFYLLLLVIGATGLIFAFRSPSASTPITKELATSLERVDQVAQSESGDAKEIPQTPMKMQQPYVAQPWSVRLHALSVTEGLNTAITQLSTGSSLSPSDRLQMISYLREHEQDDPDAINNFALKDLALTHLPAEHSPEWRSNYIENVAHLYLETSSAPENSLNELIGIAEGYTNAPDRKSLIGSYLQLFPEKKSDVDRAIAGRLDQ